MEFKTRNLTNTQKKRDDSDESEHSEEIYKRKVEFLKIIGLNPSKEPNFELLSHYLQSEIQKEIAFEIIVINKIEEQILEIITSHSELKPSKGKKKVSLEFDTLNRIHFSFEFLIIKEKEVNELGIELKIHSNLDDAFYRRSIFTREDIRNKEYIDEEETFQEFDTMLPLEETMQVPMNTHLYFDVMDKDGNVETVLIKSRIE